MQDKLIYQTRDGTGNDIEKEVEIKQFKTVLTDAICPICKRPCGSGVKVTDIVSGNFTDWAYMGDYICEECSQYFSLYKYSYVIDPDGIRLMNVRQIRDEITKHQKPPFRFVISTSQKKHLFYKTPINYSAERFAVNLETETIYTTCEKQEALFDFVENMRVLGQNRDVLGEGNIQFDVLQKTGFEALEILNYELSTSREIQIPLFCAQKPERSEEEALCYINSALTILKEQRRH